MFRKIAKCSPKFRSRVSRNSREISRNTKSNILRNYENENFRSHPTWSLGNVANGSWSVFANPDTAPSKMCFTIIICTVPIPIWCNNYMCSGSTCQPGATCLTPAAPSINSCWSMAHLWTRDSTSVWYASSLYRSVVLSYLQRDVKSELGPRHFFTTCHRVNASPQCFSTVFHASSPFQMRRKYSAFFIRTQLAQPSSPLRT